MLQIILFHGNINVFLTDAGKVEPVIHSDFFAKFIRAEVVHYDHFITAGGSFAKTKESGQWRLEGKEYIVKDGDIIEFMFNV